MAVTVVQVRVGHGRGLAGRVVRAAGYDAKVPGTQHGALLVGRRGRQVRRQLGRIVGLLVQPGRTGVAQLAEQRPERRQELLAVPGRVSSVLHKYRQTGRVKTTTNVLRAHRMFKVWSPGFETFLGTINY